jgi:hypothetical protein
MMQEKVVVISLGLVVTCRKTVPSTYRRIGKAFLAAGAFPLP